MLEFLADQYHIVGVCSHSHHAADAHVVHCLENLGIQDILGFFHAEAEFRFLFRDVELQQAVDNSVVLNCFFINGLQQIEGVDGMNQPRERYDVFDFVCLQMSDEMPVDVLWQNLVFVAHLERMVLAEYTLSGFVSLLYVLHRLRLRHRHQNDSLRNRFSYFFQIFLDHINKNLNTQN